MSLEIRLKRVDRLYSPGERVSGVLVIETASSMSHNGITLTADGVVSMQLSSKSQGLFEAFYQSLKPIEMLHYEICVAEAGKIPKGVTELPFEFPLEPIDGQSLFESYHGVFINVSYSIKAEIARGVLAKNIAKSLEFIVEMPGVPMPPPTPIEFLITPDSLENVKKRDKSAVPDFRISGRLDSGVCAINAPITGEVTIEHSSAVIKSIELQLVRVETCGCADGYAKEATEIQNIQVAEGDVCRNLAIPLYSVLPRLFSCPTLAQRTFKIEFELNLVVLLENNLLISENHSIRIVRPDVKGLSFLG